MMAVNQSNLPTSRSFKFEDYKGAPQWFAQFLQSLVLFTDPVYQVLNGGVTYQNLTIPKTYTLNITAPASGDVTFNFPNPLRIDPSAVLIGKIFQTGVTPIAFPTSSTSVYWYLSQNIIYVTRIPNLTATKTYSLTLVIL